VIRSLTVGLPTEDLSTSEIEARVRRLLDVAHRALAKRALTPRTVRFTLPVCGAADEGEGVLLSRLRWVDDLSTRTGIRWFCLPVDLVQAASYRGRLAASLDAIGRFERMFLNLILASDGNIAVNAFHDAAQLVLNASRKSNNGFDNFRIGVSFNCPTNAPFFPFSRHEGNDLAFSCAVETTQIAQQVLSTCRSPQDLGVARDRIAGALDPVLRSIDSAGREIAQESGTEYRGLDASLAPMPSDDVSVAGLVEKLIGMATGSHASLCATALLTDAVRTAVVASGAKTVGFNGLMYSLLEDRRLAAANNQRRISIDSLLALSAVCACGLDMIPIPGSSFPEEIAALMLDVAALSCSLDKPLGARLLPIPGGHAGELTRLNLDFLCDSRIMELTSNDGRFATEAPLLVLRSPRHRAGREGGKR
jgi:uncharacterized protein (UPF0210 family)